MDVQVPSRLLLYLLYIYYLQKKKICSKRLDFEKDWMYNRGRIRYKNIPRGDER